MPTPLARSACASSEAKCAWAWPRVLKEEGYIHDYMSIDDATQGVIEIDLKYGPRAKR